ncbi:hypothetical protein PFDG_05316, partial [Plasmodium falciparum Dd2]
HDTLREYAYRLIANSVYDRELALSVVKQICFSKRPLLDIKKDVEDTQKLSVFQKVEKESHQEWLCWNFFKFPFAALI